MSTRRVILLLAALLANHGSVAGAEPATRPAPDWPHWRGPTGDNKSPLSGIRKDWAGGLTKVWSKLPGSLILKTVTASGRSKKYSSVSSK